ncbi:uncharacterized protein PHACADRAFT_202007 [Phanerochaete carnosa HHB-10118-sp]|uniref:ABC transporter domain-containing protein n=1 Tax=Phanerochaete carnosa (strain HHB-10118-sp) TaxID=650164 RepID=K5UHV3_PHACS|nr:uncharacterized protein PHACADRAFT_202007 [Phanerochaete carnosa HHB-10118-sp]EKM49106.1 hypothetical protein PHACADRAFT_202007 [Phanerochaete carnosa HHB-10118-sp]
MWPQYLIGFIVAFLIGSVYLSFGLIFDKDENSAEDTWPRRHGSMVGLTCVPLVILGGFVHLHIVIIKDQKNKKAHEHSIHLACEAASSIRTVASLTREEDCLHLYSESLESLLQESKTSSFWSNMLYTITQSLAPSNSSFQLFVALQMTVFSSMQADNVVSFVPDMSSAWGAAADIVNLLDSKPSIDADSTESSIHFENIHFWYPTRPGVCILRDLNLTVGSGTYVALVGASGCGKRTTIQLPIEYRKHIALASQEPTLYASTIRFNILLGATKPAKKNSRPSLPDSFDTKVGGKGSQLSGGHCDCADNSTLEKIVQEALDSAAKGQTTIVIAHRLPTIQNADCIYFIKDGAVHKSGIHDKLIALYGGYYECVQIQALNKR